MKTILYAPLGLIVPVSGNKANTTWTKIGECIFAQAS